MREPRGRTARGLFFTRRKRPFPDGFKDGKRVLSPEEKAEAYAPTNKQWLDTIGGPTGSRR